VSSSLPSGWTSDSLAAAADENLVVHASWAPLHLEAARVQHDDDLVLVDSGLPCDTFNLVCRAWLAPDAALERIMDALEFFAVTGHPFSWWLGPAYAPTDLPALLQDAGLQPAETELAMALDLADLPAPPERPATLHIRRVQTSRDLAAFAKISAANWSPPDPEVLRFYGLAESALLTPDTPQWLYLGLLDTIPVATAELTVGGGLVGVYNVSTAPAFRGRGIGTAMIHTPLAAAQDAGHRTAILQAAPPGVGVYQRLGFASFGMVTEFKPGP
jgi:GNAT superfamily N-acetyltransferase